MTTPMTSMRSVEDLKPCPFCGGADFEICRADVSWVDCATCGAEGPWHYTPDGADDVVAIAAWNTRQSLAQDTGGWQDISTAPKDGTLLDLWIDDGSDSVRRTDCFWGRPEHTCGEAGQYCDCCPAYEGWVDSTFNHYLTGDDGLGEDPTHWRYPPAAPTPKGSEA